VAASALTEECSEGGVFAAATMAAVAGAEFDAVPPKLDSELLEGAMLTVEAAVPLPQPPAAKVGATLLEIQLSASPRL